MWLRGLTTSAIISLLATFLVFNFPQFFFSFGPLFLVLLMSTFISSMAIVYGRQITRRLKREKGAIKWFDPSKGYGFVERDKGGDLFVHFASVNESDRKLYKLVYKSADRDLAKSICKFSKKIEINCLIKNK